METKKIIMPAKIDEKGGKTTPNVKVRQKRAKEIDWRLDELRDDSDSGDSDGEFFVGEAQALQIVFDE